MPFKKPQRWFRNGDDISYVDGKVGIGTSSPDSILHLKDSSGTTPPIVTIEREDALVNTGDVLGEINWKAGEVTQTTVGFIRAEADQNTWTPTRSDTRLVFGTAPAGGDKIAIERMRIDRDGNVGIGTTTPDTLLEVVSTGEAIITASTYSDTGATNPAFRLQHSRGTEATPTATQDGDILGEIQVGGFDTAISINRAISFDAAGEWGTSGDTSDTPFDMHFWTCPNGTQTEVERMKISEDGGVSIGATSSGGFRFRVVEDSATNLIAEFVNTGTETTADVMRLTIDVANAVAGNRFLTLRDVGGTQGTIQGQSDGSGVDYVATSDEKTKREIKDMPTALNEIMAMRPVHYKRKTAPLDAGFAHGFIAQELQVVNPMYVSEIPGKGRDEDLLGIDYGKLTPVIIKGMQEQESVIQELKTEIKLLKQNK